MQNSFVKRTVRCLKKLKKNLRAMFYLYLIKLFEKIRTSVERFVKV